MKRIFSLIGSIIGIASNALILICSSIFFGFSFNTDFFVVNFFVFATALVGLVLSILVLPFWRKSIEEYAKRKHFFITLIVFNFITAFFVLVASLLVPDVLILFFLSFCELNITSSILFLVELRFERKRGNSVASEIKTDTQESSYQDNVKEEKTPEDVLLEEKIEKLNFMKEKGVITEEEYQKFRTKYINDYFNK